VTKQSMWKQIWWQYKTLPKEMKRLNCDIILNTAGSTFSSFTPSITMSRDMLTFDRKEIDRYELGRDWLRLFTLRSVRIRAFKKATGVLFLTNYAAETIQTWTGKIKNYRVIPHGIGKPFKENTLKSVYPKNGERPVRCLYISNVARYKHQWNVAEAIAELKKEGFDIELQLVGGGSGPGQKRLESVLSKVDPEEKFIKQLDFVKHDEIPKILSEADIFIFASSCENMPNTLVEAMAFGIPIASSNLGPMPEVLEDAGVYFHPERISSIVKAVKTLLTDEDTRKHSAMKSKELSRKYSWSRCATETLNFLTENITVDKNTTGRKNNIHEKV